MRETEKQKMVYSARKDPSNNSNNNNNNKIRNSCIVNSSFVEQLKKNMNNNNYKNNNPDIKTRSQNMIKKNNEKELNININNVEINTNNEENNDDLNRTFSLAMPIKLKDDNDDMNRTQSIAIHNKGGRKISNFIKEKLNFLHNRHKNNKNNNTNLNKSTDKIKEQKKPISNIQNKKPIEKNMKNISHAESSKELSKILTKSTSSSNLKINNKLKNKLPELSSKEVDQLKAIDDTKSTSISSNISPVTELILDSINYDTFLEQQNKKEIDENLNINNNLNNINSNGNKERETFCEGFFIASFPKQNGKVIENSFSFRAPCGHIKCAKLPAMKPEIIMRYPVKDTKNLEINNLAASICFPTGIKICYFENNPSIMRDYVTPITNQKGERYYMMTYHFFHKMTNYEFTKTFEENPLKHHLKRFGEAYISFRGDELTQKMVNEIQETLKFCEELGFRDFVYIPYCLCLISKYPYIIEMEKCLQSIYYLMLNQINDDKIELNKILMFLIHSIPIPLNRNSKLKFYMPYFPNGIEIACPKLNDINIININVSVLFKWFSIDNIIIILRLILFEKKLLFVDDNYERLSNVIDIFISLIYPFKWIHTYIPIMSEEMINYIETFLPFVNGVHNSLLYLIKNLIKESASETESKVVLIQQMREIMMRKMYSF